MHYFPQRYNRVSYCSLTAFGLERRMMMAYWNTQRPCVTCGATIGEQVRCANCGTLGCYKCVGTVSKATYCKVCRKSPVEIKRV